MKNLYVPSLKALGLAPLKIPPETTQLFEHTLSSFADARTFRFPPQEGLPFERWPDLYKECYVKLEDIGKNCYWELLTELSQDNRLLPKDPALDMKNIAFNSSFMNIFNYKYGFLKPHRDRCLITIVYRQYQNKQSRFETEDTLSVSPSSKILWSHDISFSPTEEQSNWMNVDDILCSENNQACMFIGEEMATLSGNYLSANEHCVTGHPSLPYVAHSNDLASDRMSLALILSSPTLSSYIEGKV